MTSQTSDDDDGLRIVMSPVQLAAVLQGATLSETETFMGRFWNRAFGGLELIGGAFELVGAGGLAATPEPTMLTKVGAAILALNGFDNFGTGAAQLLDGQSRNTLTGQAAQAAARALGLSLSSSRKVGIIVDIAVPLSVSLGLGAARIAAIRAGRINLAAEEAAGGHTIAKHVGMDEPYLRRRLANEPRIPAAATFNTLAEAEKYVSDAMKANRSVVTAWAKKDVTSQQRPLVFSYDAGRPVGIVISRNIGVLKITTKLRIVLVKKMSGQKTYFVLTSYPVP